MFDIYQDVELLPRPVSLPLRLRSYLFTFSFLPIKTRCYLQDSHPYVKVKVKRKEIDEMLHKCRRSSLGLNLIWHELTLFMISVVGICDILWQLLLFSWFQHTHTHTHARTRTHTHTHTHTHTNVSGYFTLPQSPCITNI